MLVDFYASSFDTGSEVGPERHNVLAILLNRGERIIGSNNSDDIGAC